MLCTCDTLSRRNGRYGQNQRPLNDQHLLGTAVHHQVGEPGSSYGKCLRSVTGCQAMHNLRI